MSRKGMLADNALIESFYTGLKCETFYLEQDFACYSYYGKLASAIVSQEVVFSN